MSTPGRSRATAAGLTLMLISVSAGMQFGAGGFGLPLCVVGVLVGASIVAAGVCMADDPAPIVPVVIGGAPALAAFKRRNVTGLVMTSCAITVVSCEEEDPVLSFGMFALLLLGLILVAVGVRMADGPANATPILTVVFASKEALAELVNRNTAVVGLVMASCAVTEVSGEEDPVLCFGMFALLLLGLILINLGSSVPAFFEALMNQT